MINSEIMCSDSLREIHVFRFTQRDSCVQIHSERSMCSDSLRFTQRDSCVQIHSERFMCSDSLRKIHVCVCVCVWGGDCLCKCVCVCYPSDTLLCLSTHVRSDVHRQ